MALLWRKENPDGHVSNLHFVHVDGSDDAINASGKQVADIIAEEIPPDFVILKRSNGGCDHTCQVWFHIVRRQLSLLPDQGESPSAVSVYLNLSRALYAVNRYDDAAEFVARAEAIDAGRAAEYGYVAAGGSDGARASSRTAAPILFVDDEEE